MIVSQQELLSRMSLSEDNPWEKRLIIEPLFRTNTDIPTAAASVDFHLGNRFSVPRRERAVRHDPVAVKTHREVATAEYFVALGQEFLLHPGQFVLGATLEWFRFPMDLMAYVVGRSIWGRTGLLIVTATAVQPGSAGTITLELSNVGEIAVVLKPGVAIGQLFFHKAGSPAGLMSQRSRFSASYRPTLGEYSRSPIEDFLLYGTTTA